MELQQKSGITYDFSGQPDARNGWTFLSSEEGEPVYIPFEGTYASKGGRIRSPRFSLNKPESKAAFYHLTFTAQAAVQGYWWVDFYDKDGKMLPDINSALYASEEEMRQDGVFLADPRSVTAEISFVTKKGVSVRDIRLEPFTPAEAADWCDRLYAGLPKKLFQISKDAFALLPKTKAALNNGTPWRILLLGDSLVNDTWCSNFQALVMRDFPNAKPDFMVSVRGSTGAAYYCIPEHFQEYVGPHRKSSRKHSVFALQSRLRASGNCRQGRQYRDGSITTKKQNQTKIIGGILSWHLKKSQLLSSR